MLQILTNPLSPVAAAGLPDPRHYHAVAMCRFARDCLYRMGDVVRRLEVTLGPDTSELALRVGLHSGPVTAGVLRGDCARFELFGLVCHKQNQDRKQR